MGQENDPLIGMTVQDYVLQKVIGRGAMATVYLAQHAKTGQAVAVKFLAGEFAVKDEFVTRFMHEAEACAMLDHENIMRVYTAGQDAGLHFMVLEFVDGVDLGYFLKVQDRVKESQALPWMKQAAGALAYAHQRGIIHRDLKPENIMVTKEGLVKIADLGLSKNLGAEQELSMTMSGTVIGTPYYIAPEQARDAKRVDIRADIYSLGATFYHLLTGRPPFEGNSAAEVMANHMNKALVNPQRLNHTLGDGISDLITKMMEKDAINRFQTMEELIEAIERVERGETAIPGKVKLKSRGDSAIQPASKSSTFRVIVRNRWAIGAVGAMAVLVWIYLVATGGKKHTPGPVGTNTVVVVTPPVKPPSQDTNAPPEQTTNATPVEIAGSTNAAPANPPGPGEETPWTPDVPSPSVPSLNVKLPSSFHWVDVFALLFILLGIPAAQQVGIIWGTIRAAAFWIALGIAFRVLGHVNLWLCAEIRFPQPGAGFIALLFVSLVFLMPAWVLTHRLRIRERASVKNRFERFITIIPGVVLGWAFATVVMAFFSIVTPNEVPVAESFVGSWAQEHYPVIKHINPAASERRR